MGRGACLKKFFQKRREEVRAGQGVPPVNREDGMQVTLEEALTFALSFGGKLNSPDDPLPPSSIRCFALILTALAGAHKPRVGRSCLVASAVCGFEEGGVSGKVMRDALLSDMLS